MTRHTHPLELSPFKGPGAASTARAVADTYLGGDDMADSTCRFSDCPKPARSRGWCQMHYARWKRHGDPAIRKTGGPGPAPILDLLLRHVDASGDCWEWTGHISERGYGRSYSRGGSGQAHRALWIQLVGPIPDGLTLDHLCRNKRCVNPDHLEPVSPGDNFRRGFRWQADVCARGHEWTEENTLWLTSGKRTCRTCHAEYRAEYNRLRRENPRGARVQVSQAPRGDGGSRVRVWPPKEGE